MPTYEYRCDACGHEFEEFQKISDLPIDRCPKCKKKKARRQISQGNFILKGGGWYVTDYKTGGGRKAARDKERTDAASAKSAETKPADTKPAESKPAETKSAESKSEAKDDKPSKKAADK